MREIISIGVGAYGLNSTDGFMRELNREHQDDFKIHSDIQEEEKLKNAYPEIFFEETQKGDWKSRALMIDSDTMCIDSIRSKDPKIYGVDNFCC